MYFARCWYAVAAVCAAGLMLFVATTPHGPELHPVDPCFVAARCLPEPGGGLYGGRPMYLPL